MSATPSWRAGFELEVILGDLGEPRFERELREGEAMDEASPGFYVVPEYGLDPLNWPEDRLAGVELLTPPLLVDDAEIVRSELCDAIYEIDGDFNFFESEHTANCGWHINIDAGNGHQPFGLFVAPGHGFDFPVIGQDLLIEYENALVDVVE